MNDHPDAHVVFDYVPVNQKGELNIINNLNTEWKELFSEWERVAKTNKTISFRDWLVLNYTSPKKI